MRGRVVFIPDKKKPAHFFLFSIAIGIVHGMVWYGMHITSMLLFIQLIVIATAYSHQGDIEVSSDKRRERPRFYNDAAGTQEIMR